MMPHLLGWSAVALLLSALLTGSAYAIIPPERSPWSYIALVTCAACAGLGGAVLLAWIWVS